MLQTLSVSIPRTTTCLIKVWQFKQIEWKLSFSREIMMWFGKAKQVPFPALISHPVKCRRSLLLVWPHFSFVWDLTANLKLVHTDGLPCGDREHFKQKMPLCPQKRRSKVPKPLYSSTCIIQRCIKCSLVLWMILESWWYSSAWRQPGSFLVIESLWI